MNPTMAQMKMALANNQQNNNQPTNNQHVGMTNPISTEHTYNGYTYNGAPAGVNTNKGSDSITIPWGGNKGLAPWVTAQNINAIYGNNNLSTNPADYPDYKAPPPPVNITLDPVAHTVSGPNGPITNPFNMMHPTTVPSSAPRLKMPSFMDTAGQGGNHIYDANGNDVSYLIPQSTKGPSPHVSKGYADGGLARPTAIDLKNIGANEAPGMTPKSFFSPDQSGSIKVPPPGGVAMPNGMAIGGIDANPQQPGQQMTQPDQQGGQPGQPQQGAPAAPCWG